ncbi:unnamed protein product [Cuscuta campestris]|uniref:Proteasome endopeptidase complex n=1 Tax=Cuscuta campestris TaxID=132261 RepID=A0A484LKU8_9ASTE|nr:unnamed protein product [Cuscuta campestris]
MVTTPGPPVSELSFDESEPAASSHINNTSSRPRPDCHTYKFRSGNPFGLPKYEKGMTTLGFSYEMGAIIAVEHSNKSSTFPPNVVNLSSHMLATISGGHEILLGNLRKKCQQHELEEGRRTKIAEALQWLREILCAYGKEDLEIGMLIAVWDEMDETERGVYRINGKGELLTEGESFLATGCGTVGAVLALEYVMMPYMDKVITTSEAADLAKIAICIDSYTAPESGDRVSVYLLDSNGCVELLNDDIIEWQDENIEAPRCKFEYIGP